MQTRMMAAAAAACVVVAPATAQLTSLPCFESNLGTNLGLGDDQVAPANALGFTFPGPGNVSVAAIDISSNGFVWLGTDPNSRCCDGDPLAFVSDQPSIAPWWVDLYPPGAGPNGGVFFNTFPASPAGPARAVVTWADLPEFGTNGPNFTIQLQLDSTGAISFYYDANLSNQWHTALLGVTEGSANPTGSAVANPVDFSAISVANLMNTATNPTVYEAMLGTDVAARSFEFLPNGQGGYLIVDRPTCQPANFTKYGRGCPQPPVVYEFFQQPSVIDLSNTAIDFLPNGSGGWAVVPTTGFYTASNTPIATGDDQVTGPFNLGFTFNFPGGSTNAIDVSSNGFIWLSTGNSDPRCCFGDPVAFLADPASICGHWMDHDPSSGGTVAVDPDPANGALHVTWTNVPEYGAFNTSTFQISLYATGAFRLAYQGVTSSFHDSLTGFSSGAVPIDPGSIDLSASIPFSTGSGGIPLGLDAQAGSRPVLGGPFTLELANVAPASTFGVMVFGVGQLIPGVDLTGIGMPGCTQYVTLDASVFFPLAPLPQLTIGIPNRSVLVGYSVFVQAATLTPGINPLGVLASNAGVMALGR
jgi:hypothetical protein